MPGGVHEHMRAWDPEEDNVIITLLDQLGPKWSRIVQQLPGRSVSSVRNRWQRIEKGRKLREAGKESKNRCQRCGMPKRGHVCAAKLKNRADGGVESAADEAWEETAQTSGDDSDGASATPGLSRQGSEALFPPSTVAAANAHAGPSADIGGDEGSAATLSTLRDGPSPMEVSAGVVPFSPAVPMLGRLKSEGRIQSELGFEALAAAAIHLSERDEQDAARLTPRGPAVVPVVTRQMSDAPPLPPLGREPSLLRLPSMGSALASSARAAAATSPSEEGCTAPAPGANPNVDIRSDLMVACDLAAMPLAGANSRLGEGKLDGPPQLDMEQHASDSGSTAASDSGSAAQQPPR